MVVRADFTVSAENLTWTGPSTLTEIIPGVRFRTPDHYYENTLIVMLNGLPLSAENDDGYTVIDDETFELKEALPFPRSWIMVGYVKKEV